MDDKLARLIWLQAGLQRDAYGYDFAAMSSAERVSYVRDQHQAAVMELCEVLDEVDWKPWTNGARIPIHREAYVNELIDVLHFWVNMVLAVCGDMSPTEVADEIFTRFALKNQVNAERQTAGYDGRSTKCGGCGRALDDPGVACTRRDDQGHCAKNDVDVNYLKSASSPEVTTCVLCDLDVKINGCERPTTDRWGYCMADAGSVRNLPPIKLSTT